MQSLIVMIRWISVQTGIFLTEHGPKLVDEIFAAIMSAN